MVRESNECCAYAIFGHVVCWVERVKLFFSVIERVFGFPIIGRDEIFGVANMPFRPFQFVEFGQIFDEILVGFKRFGYLADVDYSGSREFVPNLPDNGVG